jgi:hypothetical protein
LPGVPAQKAEPATSRFVHGVIMATLLIAALAVIWNVLGGR